MPDFDDEDFFLDDDDLAADYQLTILDEAKLKVIDFILESASELKNNINYTEKQNFSANLSSIARRVSMLIDLENAESIEDEDKLSEKIDEIMRSCTEITYSNMDNVIPDISGSVDIEDNSSSDDDDNSLDF